MRLKFLLETFYQNLKFIIFLVTHTIRSNPSLVIFFCTLLGRVLFLIFIFTSLLFLLLLILLHLFTLFLWRHCLNYFYQGISAKILQFLRLIIWRIIHVFFHCPHTTIALVSAKWLLRLFLCFLLLPLLLEVFSTMRVTLVKRLSFVQLLIVLIEIPFSLVLRNKILICVSQLLLRQFILDLLNVS